MTTNANRNSQSVHRLDGLEVRVDSLEAGAVPFHNALDDRDAADAHPTSSITGLDAALASLEADVLANTSAIDDKVDIVPGKQLSTEDYTTAEKNKLSDIAAGAQNNTASNVGLSGAGIFQSKVGSDLQFKKVVAGSNVTITEQPETITISSAGGGGGEVPVNHNELLNRDAVDCHPISAITGLQTALNGKAPTAHTHTIANVTGLQTALDGKAATSHTHTIANVTGLQTALDGKAPTSHTHTIANVTGLQTELDGKEDAGVAQSLIDDVKLVERIKSKATLIADFVNNQFKIYESPYGLEPKQLFDVITTTRASDATVNTPFGLETRAANIARIDYDPLTGEPLGLLSEQSRTNLLLHSADFTQAAWAKQGAALVDTTAVVSSILGVNYQEISGIGSVPDRLQQLVAFTDSGQEFTASVVAKADVGQTVTLAIGFTGGTSYLPSRARVNLLDGTNTVVGTPAATVATKRQIDGSYHISITQSANSAGNTSVNLRIYQEPDGVLSMGSILLTAAQLEAGPHTTSYIPTTTVAVPRVKDQNVLTPVHNTNEFTVYGEFLGAQLSVFNRALSVGTSTTNRMEFVNNGFATQIAGDTIRIISVVGGFLPTQRYKVAYKFIDGIVTLAVNGAIIGSTTQSVNRTFASTNIKLSSNAADNQPSTVTFAEADYYPRALSNAELIALTQG